jgi:DNA-binding MarR family transcriptional regulator
MAEKFSRWFRSARPPQRAAALRLSPLQQSIMHWLRNELRRRQRLGDVDMVPFPDLVRALHADKASITREVRYLLQKGLLSVTLPAGEWVRYVMLTEYGDTYAQTLAEHTPHVRRRGEVPRRGRPSA